MSRFLIEIRVHHLPSNIIYVGHASDEGVVDEVATMEEAILRIDTLQQIYAKAPYLVIFAKSHKRFDERRISVKTEFSPVEMVIPQSIAQESIMSYQAVQLADGDEV